MGGSQGGGPYEAELNQIRALQDWRVPKAASLRTALNSLDRALGTVLESSAWEGSSAEAARASLTRLQQNFRIIETSVGQLADTIDNANTYRRNAAAAELPSAHVDSFWANAAKVGSVVVHPVLGPLAADKALDVIGGFLGNQREEQAKRVVEQIQRDLAPSARSLNAASSTLADFDPRVAVPTPPEKPVSPGTTINAPDITTPGGIGGPSGSQPGVGNHPPVPAAPTHPQIPGGGSGGPGITGPGTGGGTNPGGSGGGGNGGSGGPSVDFPGGGVLPGGPGGSGGGAGGGGGTGIGGGGGYPGGPGGMLPGGGTGGGGLGGIVGGGAGAAAIAASSKIAGFGSMGGLGGSGLGAASGAGLKAGGGLLGNSALGGAGGVGGIGGPAGTGVGGAGGVGGVGGAGGAGAGGAGSSGVAGAGGRPGMGMMGGAGGADDEDKAKRSGLGGPIAPKLEDDEQSGPRAKGARAGSRDEPTS